MFLCSLHKHTFVVLNSIYMKKLSFFASLAFAGLGQLLAQCPQQPTLNVTPQPTTCSNAFNIVPYFNQCRTLCVSNVNAGASSGVADLSCFGGSAPNDVWFTAPNPYSAIAGYDGSLVFRWVDWPGRTTGAVSPTMAMHAEIAGSAAGGLVNINIDCTSPAPTQSLNFALENAFCINQSALSNNQFYAPPGTIPTVAQIVNSGQVPSGVSINNIQYYMQAVASNNLTGNMCFEVSPYTQGFLCGDPKAITLTGNSTSVTGSATGCLCNNAIDGTMFRNVTNNLPVPCGVEEPSAAWYAIQLPYTCNQVSVSIPNWGGTGSYNLALLSNVSCPNATGSNPFTGAPVTTFGQTLQPGSVVEAGGCSQALNPCTPLPAGTYYIYISGATERPTFTVNVTVTNASPSAGTVSSPQANSNICSGGNIQLNTSGAVIPASACGQNLAWFYSTNIAFNPYNGQGTYIASGTGNQNISLPANTTCSPITYYIKGIISDNGTTAAARCQGVTNSLSVTVYPEIGQPTVINNPCIIQVAGRCPSFTVNGSSGSTTYLATFADDGTQQQFTISNGLAGCNVVVSETVSCSGNCTQPTATAQSVCNSNDPYNFYVDVVFSPGSASSYNITGSDGSALPISAAGTYRVGPFANGSSVTLSVTNTEDANCNLPLGSYSRRCNTTTCPNLTSAFASIQGGGNTACGNSTILLQATVDQGVLNTSYTAQWYMNGVAIPGANLLVYNHTATTTQGCNPEVQVYSVRITCLDPNAAPSTTSLMNVSGGPVTVYPVPSFGRDFYPSPNNCEVMPVDVCGGLNLTYSPVTNPAPGSGATLVNYTAAVQGAPNGCSATGSYTIQCPVACTNTPGTGVTPSDNVVCHGGQFTVATTGANVGQGYAIGYAVTTTNPYGNLQQAVQTAISQGSYIGPFTASQSATFVNGTDYGPGTYYFIPFVSLDIPTATSFQYQTNGSLNVPAPVWNTHTATVTVPQMPYCNGVTRFNISYQAQKSSGSGNPINSVSGLVSYTGGSTSNTGVLTNNNYANNPSGQTIQVSCTSSFGSAITYNATVRYAQAYPFPTVCTGCFDIGNPVVYVLQPQITLSSINAPTVCQGASLDLTALNPTANMPGRYTWYNGDPNNGGSQLASPVVSPSGNTTYWVLFETNQDTTCRATQSVAITPTALPTLNPIPVQAPICAGATVNLNALNSGITSASGTFVWYKGDPSQPGAIRYTSTNAANMIPTPGAAYYCQFTSLATGCSNSVSVTYSVNPVPTLTPPVVSPSVCPNTSYDLTSLEANLTSEAGTFAWFRGNPNSGGVAITTPTSVTPTSTAATYCVRFTSSATNCSNVACITFNINTNPVLNSVPQQGPICAGSIIDLTSHQSAMTSDAGAFVWYLGNPTSGGTVIANPSAVVATPGQQYWARFTNTLTGCSSNASVSYFINASPTLQPVSPSAVCSGTNYDLTTLESQMATSVGLFAWHNGVPDANNRLTLTQSRNQLLSSSSTYYAVFSNAFNCTDTAMVTIPVNATPVLGSLNDSSVCAAQVVDLTSNHVVLTSDQGTFVWYNGNPASGGSILNLAQSQSQTINTASTYYVRFTASNGCTASESYTLTPFAPVTGATASYDCIGNSLVVNINSAIGGSGSGYIVATNSPNQHGQSLNNGASWTVIVADNAGCTQTPLTGVVSCIVCDAGTATANGSTTVCCQDSVIVVPQGSTLLPGSSIAWVLTPAANGPADDSLDVRAAQANNLVYPTTRPDGGLVFRHNCQVANGQYYLTPFTAQSINVEPFVWDTLNDNCRPNGEICPDLVYDPNLTNWVIDTLFLTYPNGQTVDLVQVLTRTQFPPSGIHLPVTTGILALLPGGALPCLPLTFLYDGNPNGVWTFSGTNVGTDPITMNVPAFQIRNEADSCAALNGVDQLVTIPAFSITMPAGQFNSYSFTVPPLPGSFPTFNNNCYDFGAPILIDVCNSIETTNFISGLKVFPNPTEETTQVSFELENSQCVQYFVSDVLGRKVAAYDLGLQSGKVAFSVNVSELSAGVYLLNIQVGGRPQTVKLVVK